MTLRTPTEPLAVQAAMPRGIQTEVRWVNLYRGATTDEVFTGGITFDSRDAAEHKHFPDEGRKLRWLGAYPVTLYR